MRAWPLVCALFVASSATRTSAARNTDVDVATTSRAWTACMTASTPARTMLRDCTVALGSADLSPFHASLLLTQRGDASAALGRLRDALADYSRALSFEPHDEDTLGRRALAYLHLGDARSAIRDASAAIARYDATPANRSNGSASVIAGYYVTRGRARELACDPRGAASDFFAARTHSRRVGLGQERPSRHS